ncbi:MAG TPA: phosphoglycolate phosphatase [Gammaproteobacteria bacterium]|nr:phosphoglycolate phosphatase [Gammaproteobacteria bacterium]
MTPAACLLFDLDGTLLDTAPDMIAALNRVLADENRDPLPPERLRDHVSHGSAALVRLAFGEHQPEAAFEDRKARFLRYYRENLCIQTRLFPGMADVLDHAERAGVAWGVVTNKPGWLTDPLMVETGLMERAACVISGDTTEERKPHPLPMLTAAEQAGVAPEQCLYVGDAERDIEAGKAAGMQTLIAAWGYIDADQQPHTWGADRTIEHPGELVSFLP